MGIDPLRQGSEGFDLRNRFVSSSAIVGSPALAAETIICQIAIAENEAVTQAVWLDGWAAFTVGTSGTAVRLRIRRTNVGGTLVGDSGPLTGGVAAGALLAQDVAAIDPIALVGGAIYCLTLQVTAGAAVSTVSATTLKAIVV